ncbi:MAG: hypothetical protein GY835_11195 [bacterium]|nr:hypothetical protein [bacterium]
MKRAILLLALLIPVMVGCGDDENNPVGVGAETYFSLSVSNDIYNSSEEAYVMFCTTRRDVIPSVLVNGMELTDWVFNGDCLIGYRNYIPLSDAMILAISVNGDTYLNLSPIPEFPETVMCNGWDLHNSELPPASTYTFKWQGGQGDYYRSIARWVLNHQHLGVEYATSPADSISVSPIGYPDRMYFDLTACTGVLPESGAEPNYTCGYGSGWITVSIQKYYSFNIDNTSRDEQVPLRSEIGRGAPVRPTPEMMADQLRAAIENLQ